MAASLMDLKAGPPSDTLVELSGSAEVVCVQPLAIIDHLCSITEASVLQTVVTDEIGGSRLVSRTELQQILAQVGEFHSKAGGSAANTARGLSGFGIPTDLVGTRGFDEWGSMFISSMKRASVGTQKLAVQSGSTGRCVILSCGGKRTMRTCLDDAVRLQAADLQLEHFCGAKWVFLGGYCCYGAGLLERTVKLAKQAGTKVALDLGSFEIVRRFRSLLKQTLESGSVDLVLANEDEALELDMGSAPEETVSALTKHCQLAVVTLGERGCVCQSRGEPAFLEPAASGVKVVDTTGAGDLFASGFLFSLLRGYPLQRCAQIGCLAGGAVVQNLGAEMSAANWQWLFARLHGDLAANVVRDSASAVAQELLSCYSLVEKLGRGVVYYGSARLKEDSGHWGRAVELGREVARLLDCTTWTGGGPGMMRAASEGAMQAGRPVGGIRIAREAGTTVRSASYLPTESAVVCRFLSSRKVALVDAGVRASQDDRTAYIFLPGGLGTMDELFEIMTLMQLKKLGSKLPVPLILCNYDGFYDGLMDFLRACDQNGTLAGHELNDVVLAASNAEVLATLAEHYKLPHAMPPGLRSKVHRASSLLGMHPPAQDPNP